MNSASFSNFSSGGAVLLKDTSESQKSNFTITDSTFDSNSALSGGAVTAAEVDLKISSSVFKNNYGTFRGGALLLSCSTEDNCYFEVTDSTFTNNSATSNGGAMYWDANEPVLEYNTMLGNKAKHGDNAATYSAKIDIVSTEIVSRKLEDDAFVLQGVASGQKLPTITVKLLDSLGQLVSTDSSSTAEISSSSDKVIVSGTSKVTASEGLFVFDNVILYMDPGTNSNLTYSTTAIEKKQNSKAVFTAQARQCIIGEEIISKSCNICASGTYSLDPLNSCVDCPSQAYCYGNYSMVPRSGYWRSGVNSDNFYKCPNKDACLGSDEAKMNYKGTCASGYQGNQCNACAQGHSRTSDNTCGKCPDKTLNGVRLAVIFIGVVIVCIILVRSTLRSATESKALHSIYFKIFANYLQLIMLTAQLKLEWPQLVLDFFSVHQTAGTVAEQMFSFDCYLEDDENENSYKDIYFRKLIFFAMIPFFLCLLSLFFWFVITLFKRSSKNFSRHVMATIVVLIFLAHPSLTQSMFAVFSCTELDNGEFWLITNLDIRCWDPTHTKYALTVSLPFLIIFSIGIPTAVLGYLIRERALLNEVKNRVCLGFLYNGYKHHHFYWEFVILYRKIIIICLTVFLNTVSIPVQGLFILLILILSWQLQYYTEPFDKVKLNSMELRSIFVAAVTIYCGMFYLTKDLDEPSKICLFIVMITANAYFLSIWLIATFFAIFYKFGSKLPLIRKFALTPNHYADETSFIHDAVSTRVTVFQEEKQASLVSLPSKHVADVPIGASTDVPENIFSFFMNCQCSSIDFSRRREAYSEEDLS
jgi:hypothetical protein